MTHPAPHSDPHRSPPGEDRLQGLLAISQFVVTALLLAGIGTLAYVAGMRSAGPRHEAAPAGAAAGAVDVTALYASTPELVAKGKALFATNCASCHGNEGKGDGVAAAALTPKPRNFSSAEGWKFGSGVARVVRTITEGSPGTAMAAFTALPMADRMSLAHFVRSLQPSPAEDKPEDKTWLGIGEGGAAAPGAGAGAAAAPVAAPRIPVAEALLKLTEPDPAPGAALASQPAGDDPGAALYGARCADCHGRSGEGGVRVKMLGYTPEGYVTTRSLGAGSGGWAANPVAFERMVIEGFPGTIKPGNGDLPHEAIRQLLLHTQMLRAQQEAAARPGS